MFAVSVVRATVMLPGSKAITFQIRHLKSGLQVASKSGRQVNFPCPSVHGGKVSKETL